MASFGKAGQTYELKIGQTFLQGAQKAATTESSEFHTIRYDFIPASVDLDRMGVLSVAEDNKSVQVAVPNQDGNQQTNYGGHLKESNKKDCVLIIDSETGEITIERLTSHMLVKKLRPEKPDKSGGDVQLPTRSPQPQRPSSRPVTPFDPFKKKSSKSSPVPGRSSPASLQLPMTSQRPGSRSSSPSIPPPVRGSDGFSGISVNEMLGDMKRDAEPKTNNGIANDSTAKDDLGLSDSSSSSDDSSSDSDDNEDTRPTMSQGGGMKTLDRSSISKTVSPSMPLMDFTSAPPQAPGPAPSAAPLASMPQVLTEDLQLSESDDSDDDFDID